MNSSNGGVGCVCVCLCVMCVHVCGVDLYVHVWCRRCVCVCSVRGVGVYCVVYM